MSLIAEWSRGGRIIVVHRADARASSPGRMKYPVAGLCPRVGREKHAQPRGEARGKVEATKEHYLGGRDTMGKRAGEYTERLSDRGVRWIMIGFWNFGWKGGN